MPHPSSSMLVPPHVRPRVRKAGHLAQLCDVPRGLVLAVRSRDPRKVLRRHHSEWHR